MVSKTSKPQGWSSTFMDLCLVILTILDLSARVFLGQPKEFTVLLDDLVFVVGTWEMDFLCPFFLRDFLLLFFFPSLETDRFGIFLGTVVVISWRKGISLSVARRGFLDFAGERDLLVYSTSRFMRNSSLSCCLSPPLLEERRLMWQSFELSIFLVATGRSSSTSQSSK